MNVSVDEINHIIDSRISNHISFINSLSEKKKLKCYPNIHHNFLVKTKQETAIQIQKINSIDYFNHTFFCTYK